MFIAWEDHTMKEYNTPEIEFAPFAVEDAVTIDLSFGSNTSIEAQVSAW